MAKKESTFLNMVLTLFVVTGVAAIALAFVYKATKGPIEEAKLKKLKAAINIVVPGAEDAEINDEPIKVSAIDGVNDLEFYEVKKDGIIIGTAIKTFTNIGFSGYMSVMVGFDENGVIIDSNILEHKETPGLGDKTCKSVSNWNERFVGKDPKEFILKVKQDDGHVDAITAATITSRAYCDAIQRAYDTFMKYKSETLVVVNQDISNNDEAEPEKENLAETNNGGIE